jgi:hypothetical protein
MISLRPVSAAEKAQLIPMNAAARRAQAKKQAAQAAAIAKSSS